MIRGFCGFIIIYDFVNILYIQYTVSVKNKKYSAVHSCTVQYIVKLLLYYTVYSILIKLLLLILYCIYCTISNSTHIKKPRIFDFTSILFSAS